MKTLGLLALLALSTLGCSAGRATYTATDAHSTLPRVSDSVDVLLDQAPERPFRVVAELSASALESPASVDMMRDEAARAGLDGIYWIECTSPTSGRCKAKGFVYTTVASTSSLDGRSTAAR